MTDTPPSPSTPRCECVQVVTAFAAPTRCPDAGSYHIEGSCPNGHGVEIDLCLQHTQILTAPTTTPGRCALDGLPLNPLAITEQAA